MKDFWVNFAVWYRSTVLGPISVGILATMLLSLPIDRRTGAGLLAWFLLSSFSVFLAELLTRRTVEKLQDNKIYGDDG